MLQFCYTAHGSVTTCFNVQIFFRVSRLFKANIYTDRMVIIYAYRQNLLSRTSHVVGFDTDNESDKNKAMYLCTYRVAGMSGIKTFE